MLSKRSVCNAVPISYNINTTAVNVCRQELFSFFLGQPNFTKKSPRLRSPHFPQHATNELCVSVHSRFAAQPHSYRYPAPVAAVVAGPAGIGPEVRIYPEAYRVCGLACERLCGCTVQRFGSLLLFTIALVLFRPLRIPWRFLCNLLPKFFWIEIGKP